MLGRIRDIAYLLIFGYSSTEVRCRALERDLGSLLEKLNMMLARDAKRMSRQAHQMADALLADTAQEELPLGDRKARLRRKLFGHLRPGVVGNGGAPPDREVTDESSDQARQSAG